MRREYTGLATRDASETILVLAVVLFASLLAPRPAMGQERPADTVHADATGDFSLALTGDAIITRRMSVFEEPGFLEMRRILTEATAAFTNLEVLFHDWGEGVVPQEESGGTYMRAEPELAGELAWLGFDMVSRANNHTMDYGIGGMRATTRAVEEAGLVHAGAGDNLALARAPGYLETPGGRIALISVASTFDDPMMAGRQRKDLNGRPGLSPLRYRRTFTVPRERIVQLQEIEDGMWGRAGSTEERSEVPDTIRFLGRTIVAGESYGSGTSVHPGDLEEILHEIRAADRQADWVVVSSHTHEGADGRDVPAEFLVEFSRRAVEAGADVVVGHGPHVLRGIEIHQGRPILYSLGNFIFQNETVELQPADNYEAYDLPPSALPGEFYDARNDASGGGFAADPVYWHSVVAVPEFQDGELAEIRLHPVTLGHGLDRPVRGRPILAPDRQARTILAELRELSRPYGTEIEVVDGVGIVRPGAGGGG